MQHSRSIAEDTLNLGAGFYFFSKGRQEGDEGLARKSKVLFKYYFFISSTKLYIINILKEVKII